MDPDFELELIFIKFENQNYDLSVQLEATDTVDTIKAKYNSEYKNQLGPQHTLLYKGRALTVNDNLLNLPKNSLLHVLDGTPSNSECEEELLSSPKSYNTDVDCSELPPTDTPDVLDGTPSKCEELLSSPKSYNIDVDCSKLPPMNTPEARKETLDAVENFLTDFRNSISERSKSYNTRRSRRTRRFLPAEYAPITSTCWTAFVHSLLLHLAINEWCSKLPPTDTPENRKETLAAVEKFFNDFRESKFADYSTGQSTGTRRFVSAEYAPITCNCWTAFAHSLLLHLATDKDNYSLENFRSSLIC